MSLVLSLKPAGIFGNSEARIPILKILYSSKHFNNLSHYFAIELKIQGSCCPLLPLDFMPWLPFCFSFPVQE